MRTYGSDQIKINNLYLNTRSKELRYVLFVTDKASSTGQAGYMRLNGQFGYVFKKAPTKTAAHELGHGIFKLEHPTASNTKLLMDYSTSELLSHKDWQQIGDPAFKFYGFQGQEEGELAGINELLTLLKDKNINEFIFSVNCWWGDGYKEFYFYGQRQGNSLTIKEKRFSQEELLKLTGVKNLEKKSHFILYRIDKEWKLLVTNEDKLRTNECPIQNADAKPKDIQQIYEEFKQLKTTDYFGLSEEDFNNLKDNLDVLQANIRKDQQAEIEKWVGDKLKIFAKVNGKIIEVSKPLTDKQIDNGDWTDEVINSKIRYTFDKGVIQIKAFGFRKNLPILEGKEADLISLASDIKSKTNKFLSDNKVNNYRNEGNFTSDEAFADGKKIEIKGKYLKIISEGIGLTTSLLKTGEIEKPTYSDSSIATIKAPGLVTGTVEAGVKTLTDITQPVAMIYDLAVDKQARIEAYNGLVKIKDQIKDKPEELFPLLGEVILEEVSGNTADEWIEASNSTDKGRQGHLLSKGSVRTVATVFASGKFLAKLPDMGSVSEVLLYYKTLITGYLTIK